MAEDDFFEGKMAYLKGNFEVNLCTRRRKKQHSLLLVKAREFHKNQSLFRDDPIDNARRRSVAFSRTFTLLSFLLPEQQPPQQAPQQPQLELQLPLLEQSQTPPTDQQESKQ